MSIDRIKRVNEMIRRELSLGLFHIGMGHGHRMGDQRLGVRRPLHALHDDLAQRDLDAHQLAGIDRPDVEGDVPLLPGEETPDDAFDMLANRLKDLRRRERTLLDQQLAEALSARRALRHRGTEIGFGELADAADMAVASELG